MESYLSSEHYDLVTPDGAIKKILNRSETTLEALVRIENISPKFVGFYLDSEDIYFNMKSSLAQLGVNAVGKEYAIDPQSMSAEVHVVFTSLGYPGPTVIQNLAKECYVGKLFAADPRRRVRDPEYLLRMFNRQDRNGLPLLSLGGLNKSEHLELEKKEGFTVAYLKLKPGILELKPSIEHFIPTLIEALKYPQIKTRELLFLNQTPNKEAPRLVKSEHFLLVRTLPLHVRTVFAHVLSRDLPKGFQHTTANILQPDTKASGDVYEFFGNSSEELTHIPLEFYTLEPHREHVFFSDRDQLQSSLENSQAVFDAFKTAPQGPDVRCAVFIVKGEQMVNLTESQWIARHTDPETFPGLFDPERQTQMVQSFIRSQPTYPFLKAIENDLITSQGVLFSRYFPSPLMKKMLLGDLVQTCLKGIYFQIPSRSAGNFFSHEDRSLLLDLSKFAIPVFWADQTCGKVLQFTPKPEKDTGMFVPVCQVSEFMAATVIGVYGSTLLQLQFEQELSKILEGLLAMKKQCSHRLLNPNTPLALLTGGGRGLMEVGNRVARNLGILSCANIVDFSNIHQKPNPYIDAKMTYRIDRLIERQGEFNLDLPIFLMGGYGTDFEFALEGVRRKVEVIPPTPVILLGPKEYWRQKITSNFQENVKKGTISDATWVSNCFYCAESPSQALKVYKQFFQGTLPIGKHFPPCEDGFLTIN